MRRAATCAAGAAFVTFPSAGSGDCQLEFSAHTMGVNSLASIGSSSTSAQQQQPALLLSAGKDHKVRLWQINQQQQQQQQQQAQCVVVYVGHQEAVQAVAANPAGDCCCSGGWDGQLLLWRSGDSFMLSRIE